MTRPLIKFSHLTGPHQLLLFIRIWRPEDQNITKPVAYRFQSLSRLGGGGGGGTRCGYGSGDTPLEAKQVARRPTTKLLPYTTM